MSMKKNNISTNIINFLPLRNLESSEEMAQNAES